ncbi:LysR family transcriptional regulator [Herbaspirillum huttiense]|uniref:LysR family transcriptional regulator n=1 Tax=Herbaspirillum huttiense TaxID=863372 RepID=UPI000584EEAB|nr:LysR family transcriptional regulator [Herbaspirillum huttiense]
MDLIAHLKIFIDIADHGSLAGAARARNMAPSAITASLHRLEAHLGAQLVMRSTRKLALSQEGAQFLDHARHIVRDLEDACDQVARTGALRGAIRISSLSDFGRTTLPKHIDAFLALHPNVRFELNLDDRVVDLIDGGYDIAIRTGPLVDSRLKARLIAHAGRSVCAAPGYWKSRGKPVKPTDLKTHNCLVLSRAGAPQASWRFVENDLPVAVDVGGDRMASDGGLLRQWAVAGAGVVLKSDYDVQEDLAAGRLETALDDYKEQDINIYAVHSASRYLSRRAKLFLDFLAQACADNVG